MVQGRVDRFAMLGEPLSEVDEGGDAAPTGPAELGVQKLFAFAALEPEHLAELLLEQVGPVQLVVDLRDPGELGLLPVGEVLGVLPQRVAGAFEVAGVHAHPTLAGGVPGVTADLVQGVTGPRDDVKRIGAPDRIGGSARRPHQRSTAQRRLRRE